jgi:hypothetical protein
MLICNITTFFYRNKKFQRIFEGCFPVEMPEFRMHSPSLFAKKMGF